MPSYSCADPKGSKPQEECFGLETKATSAGSSLLGTLNRAFVLG